MDTSSLLTHHWSKDAMLQLPQVGVKAFKSDSAWENIIDWKEWKHDECLACLNRYRISSLVQRDAECLSCVLPRMMQEVAVIFGSSLESRTYICSQMLPLISSGRALGTAWTISPVLNQGQTHWLFSSLVFHFLTLFWPLRPFLFLIRVFFFPLEWSYTYHGITKHQTKCFD